MTIVTDVELEDYHSVKLKV